MGCSQGGWQGRLAWELREEEKHRGDSETFID